MSEKKTSKRQKIRSFMQRVLQKIKRSLSEQEKNVQVHQQSSPSNESSIHNSKSDIWNAEHKIPKKQPTKNTTNPSPEVQNSEVQDSEEIQSQEPHAEEIQSEEIQSQEPHTEELQKLQPEEVLPQKLLIDAEPTPNPNCYKFTLNTNIGRSFSCSPEENPTHHIGAPLLELEGVVSIFGVNNFLVLNKEPDMKWELLLDPIIQKIEEVLS